MPPNVASFKTSVYSTDFNEFEQQFSYPGAHNGTWGRPIRVNIRLSR